jgi:hypothetical protein
MAIVRITRKQIEAASAAREAALQKEPGFRAHEEQLQRMLRDAASRQKEQA